MWGMSHRSVKGLDSSGFAAFSTARDVRVIPMIQAVAEVIADIIGLGFFIVVLVLILEIKYSYKFM